MSAQAEESPSADTGGRQRKVQLWQLAPVALGVLLLLAHPLLGTRVPLPGGGVIAGFLLPALLFVIPFLRSPATQSPPPGSAPAAGPPPAPGPPPASGPPLALGGQRLAADLRRAHRQHVERRSVRADRARLAVYLVVPAAAIVAFAIVGLFGAVACFGLGAVALALLGRNASE